MNDKAEIRDIPSRFTSMTENQRQIFLISYAHEITISARGYFIDRNFEAAKICNETLHRLLAYIGTDLRNPSKVPAPSFIEMLVSGAVHRGWEEILLRSLRMSDVKDQANRTSQP